MSMTASPEAVSPIASTSASGWPGTGLERHLSDGSVDGPLEDGDGLASGLGDAGVPPAVPPQAATANVARIAIASPLTKASVPGGALRWTPMARLSLPALAHGPSEVGHSGIREIANEAIRTPGVIRLEVGQPNCAREWAAWPNSFATGRNQPLPPAFEAMCCYE